jgi:hypothetical protein
MAINILDSPQEFSPCYNPTHWLFNSSAKNKAGFSYLVDIYTGQTVGSPLARLKVPKRPTTGYGLVDLASILRSEIDHEIDLLPGAGNFLPAPGYSRVYNVQLGESSDYYSFEDSYYGPNGFVLFSSSTDRHDFEVGDQVIVQQTAPYLFSEFNGPHIVYSVVDEFSFEIEEGFQSGPVTPGKVYKADGSSISFSGLTSATGTTVGFSLPREEFTPWTTDRYIASPGNYAVELMTNAPDLKHMGRSGQGWIPVQTDGEQNILFVLTKDSAGATVGSYRIDQTGVTGSDFSYCPAGPVNLTASTFTVISGPSDMFGASVATYSLRLANISGPSSESRTFTLDDRCVPFESFSILFADKMGAWFTTEFYYKNTEENTVKKQTFARAGYAKVVGSSVTYSDQRRGFEVYNVEHIRSYTVRSNWMHQEEGDYLVECLMSPRAFWVQDPETFIPLILDDVTVERIVGDQEKDLIRYECTFTKAYKENSIG